MQIVDGKRLPTVTDDKILGFFGDYRFLSNFHVCPVRLDGFKYASSEAAYVSFKNDSLDYKFSLTGLNVNPKKAKEIGQTVQLRDDWEYYRVLAMYQAVYAKFHYNTDIRKLLLSTGEKYLEETNDWGDRFWGVVDGIGLNMLGKVLMAVRKDLWWEMDE